MGQLPVPPRFTLRQLPLAAKLVLTVFLIAVGVGYFSALVQLHLQHGSRDGQPLPTGADVVAVFAGWEQVKPLPPGQEPPRPVSKLERLITGPLDGAAWNGSGSMAAAFYHKDGESYSRTLKKDPGKKPALDAERAGEQKALRAWINTPEPDRRRAYSDDALPLPPALANQPLTDDYRTEDQKAVRVKSILTDRCVRCHDPNGNDPNAKKYSLDSYEGVLKYLDVPPAPEAPAPGTWVRSPRQTGLDRLTQSTHAHLLSFAMLFTLTGLTFAFTSYPGWLRSTLAPLVLVVQLADVACWWLARWDAPVGGEPVGIYFARAIILTGLVVGLGLAAQIVLSLFNMYGPKGKAVMLLVCAAGAGLLVAVMTQAIQPVLEAEKAAKTTVTK